MAFFKLQHFSTSLRMKIWEIFSDLAANLTFFMFWKTVFSFAQYSGSCYALEGFVI